MIKTQRLTLKPFDDADQEGMIELLTNEKVKKTFMIPDFHSKEEVEALFKKLKEDSISKNHYERGIYLHNVLIGFINDVEVEGDKIELGYVIHPAFHNKGYATEALDAAINDLFQKGFSEVIAGAFEQNVPSYRVMEKCGMCRMDREEDIEYQGVLYHCIYYSIKNKIDNLK